MKLPILAASLSKRYLRNADCRLCRAEHYRERSGILKLRMDGLTEQEIADKVGYKTASAVHKRIARIADAYEDFLTVEYR